MTQAISWRPAADSPPAPLQSERVDDWPRLIRTLGSQISADRLFEHVCRDVVTGFGFSRSMLATVDERNHRLVARAGYDPNLRTQAYMALVRLFQVPLAPRPDGRLLLAAWCALRQEQAYVPDARKDSFRPAEVTQRPFVIKALGTKEYVVTPIVYRGRTVAILGVDKKGTGKPITADDQRVLRDIAALLALRFGPMLDAGESATEGRPRRPAALGALAALRPVLDGFQEGLLILGDDDSVRFANRSAAALLGMDPEEITGRPVRDVLHVSQPKQFEQLLGAARAKSHSLRKRERLRGASGGELDVQIRVVPLPDGIEAQAILLVPGGERTEHHRFRDEVFQSVLHDLLAPVQSMVGFAELLQSGRVGQLTAEQAEFVSRIAGGGEELIRFIDRLLTVRALESRDQQPQDEIVSAAELIDAVLARVDGKALRSHVRLTHDLNGQLPPLRGDPSRLSTVFQNLVDNAIDAVPAGSTIHLSAVVHDDPRYARFSVLQEANAGSAPDTVSFDDDWTRRGAGRKRRSHGLGLAIVRRVVESYGGEVWAEGEDEGELTITFTLPLAHELPAVQATHAEEVHP